MDPTSIASAAALVKGGGLVVYPTDTVYGLGCDPTNASAVERLFLAKGRGAKPVPILCASYEKANELVELNETAARLATKHWPGPLTIVGPLRRTLPSMLAQGTGELGVRVPGHEGCLELIASCGGWITGTSANHSGERSARTAREALSQLGDSVGLVLDGGHLSGTESTVVRVVGDAVTILRSGPIGVGNEMRDRRIS
jgi:L-threonylcarbamoyladenylate synthase